jgi:hypothetical protein
MVKFSMEAKDFKEFGRFIDVWGKRTEQIFSKNVVRSYEKLGEEIATFIHGQIASALGGNFGEFMAKRTQITVKANNQGFHLNIHGIPESQLPDGDRKKANPGADNLWAVQEFGKYVSGTSDKQNIRKDVAGVTAVRKGRKGFEIQGKKGSIQALVNALMPEIEAGLGEFISRINQAKLASAGETARVTSQSKSIRGYKEFSKKLREVGVSKASLISGDISEIFTAPGTKTLVGRSATTGRFTSLGRNIKVDL